MFVQKRVSYNHSNDQSGKSPGGTAPADEEYNAVK
jgi:hypothetical protein